MNFLILTLILAAIYPGLLSATLVATGISDYTRIDHSCTLLSEEKLSCLMPLNANKCCQNCVNSRPDCNNQQRIGFVFFLYKFIPCPEGIRYCHIENIDEILSSPAFQLAFLESELSDILNLIRFQATECYDTHILLGHQCFLRDGCSRMLIQNGQLSCIQCEQGYLLTSNPNKRCQKCSVLAQTIDSQLPFISTSHCFECGGKLNQNVCTRCISNFYFAPVLSPEIRVCKQCQQNCECDSTNPCHSCVSDKFIMQISFTPNIATPHRTCVACSEIIEPHLGPNLRKLFNRYETKVTLGDIIQSCQLISNFPQLLSNNQTIEHLKLIFKPVWLLDIVGSSFTVPVFRLSNSTIETCSDGCAVCAFNSKTEIFTCLTCLNGFYLEYLNSDYKVCTECKIFNPDFLLCSSSLLFAEIKMQTVYPTQCDYNFLQPISQNSLILSNRNLCTVSPSCMVTESWTEGSITALRSCKRCIDGYHRILVDKTYNIYQCEENPKEQNQTPRTMDPFYNNPQFPLSCRPSYYFDISIKLCVKCPANCLQCRSSTECVKCNNLKAYSKIIKEDIFECVVIPLKTSDVQYCFKFGVGELADDFQKPIGGFCEVCKTNYSPVFNTSKQFSHRIEECKKQQRNCLELDIINQCKECYIGYFRNNDGLCVPFPDGCAIFDSFLQQCISCKYGYSLKYSNCIRCSHLQTINADGAFACLTIAEEISFFNYSLKSNL